MRSIICNVAARRLECIPQGRLIRCWALSQYRGSSTVLPQKYHPVVSCYDASSIPRSNQFSTALIIKDSDHHQEEEEEEGFPCRRFDELNLHAKSLEALERQGLYQLTEIQEKTFDIILSGQDVVGRARTGTGKTLSFLLPSLERIIRMQQQQQQTVPEQSSGISILILSPTRELAAQIAKEASQLIMKHGSTISSQVIYGGSSRRDDIRQFEKKLPTILVATPGRLKDHIASTKLLGGDNHQAKPFVDILQNLQVLILDETDRLLDMGFRKDVQDILSRLPKKRRQTLLFSATLPPDVREVIEVAVKPDYQLIDCIQDEDPATQTNTQTDQIYVTVPTEYFWTKTMEYLLDLCDQGNEKIIVFFPVNNMVELYSQLFNSRFGRRVLELHGKMNQRERTAISRRFRTSKKGILFTSDVSARGVDYPNVTQVIQIGSCESRETYIHRLGRTGRAGKKGKGVLILPDLEKDFLRELEGLEIQQDTSLTEQLSSSPPSKKFMNEFGPVVQKVRAGKDPKLYESIHNVYQVMIPYYCQRSENKDLAVRTVNRLVDVMGLPELPAIDETRAKRLKLNKMPGLNIQSSWSSQSWQSGWGDSGSSTSSRFGRTQGIESHPKRQPIQKGVQDVVVRSSKSFWRNDDTSRQDPSRILNMYDNRKETGRRERRAKLFQDAFSRVGPKKEDMTTLTTTKKAGKSSFQRWETKPEFSFKV